MPPVVSISDPLNAFGDSWNGSPSLSAQALWAALRGIHMLVPAMPGFPWHPVDAITEQTITALATLNTEP